MDNKCTCCGESKPRSDFHKRKNRPKGIHSICKDCRRSKDRENWVPRKQTEYKLKVNYGLSLEDYADMYALQKGRCAICFQEETARSNAGYVKNLAVDHCHTTGKVRGLLCNRCNVGIGYLDDDIVKMYNAIKYLKEGI